MPSIRETRIPSLLVKEAECKKFLEAKETKQSFVYFMAYLQELFIIREGIKITDKSKGQYQNTIFGALKYVYEKYKYETNIEKIERGSVFWCYNTSTIGFRPIYGETGVVFKSIEKLVDEDETLKEENKQALIQIYNEQLAEKKVLPILAQATKETVVKLNKVVNN